MGAEPRVAFVHGVRIGGGGLAVQSANALAALASGGEVHAFGPPPDYWPRGGAFPRVQWHALPSHIPWWSQWPILRRRGGAAQWRHDVALGQAAAAALPSTRPDVCYAFTYVALESLRWAREHGLPAILESPNGHVRAFWQVYADEHRRWCRGDYQGHPTTEMVQRVEQEYATADRIRVSSEWTRRSLVTGGVPAEKIVVLQQAVNLEAFGPAGARLRPEGPLRVVFVGSFDLRKGFVYLLRALKELGNSVSLEAIGNTVDRCTRRLFDAERDGLPVLARPGDPLPAYRRAELCVLPTLEDGSPFAVAEAMACGLPVVTTDACGAAEWVQPGRSGWVVPPRDPAAIASVLRDALRRRDELPSMGMLAREDTQRRADPARCDGAVAEWVFGPANAGHDT